MLTLICTLRIPHNMVM